MNLDVPVEEPSTASQPDSRSLNAQQQHGGRSKNSGWWQITPSPNYFAGFPHYSAKAHRYRSGFVAWPFSPMRRRLIN
jgi:hypothetical protein